MYKKKKKAALFKKELLKSFPTKAGQLGRTRDQDNR
jgi:hypothetical protein